ncbi:FG-GAP repeat domain-containing protein [Ideonella sp.]|uniref:FG-GAP repeat domain-containing protein n=1 Tax=Ideonella sp. TaxID=1929293 RepID=UPI0035AFAF1E
MKHRITRLALGIVSLALVAGFAPAPYQAQYIETSKGWGTAVADYNGDGHDDVFITGHDEHDRIWNWTPSGYVASPQVLPHVDRHDCDAGDVNRDGRMDFYCAVGADKGTGSGPNELWMQQVDGTFAKMAHNGAEDRYGSGRRPIFFDFNHDGWPDIYLTNEQHAGGNESINRVFVSRKGQHFDEVQTIATGSLGWGCVAKGDINGDGWDDLLVCNDDGPSRLFLNNQTGDFKALMSPALVGKHWIWAQLKDLNQDGKLDLISLVDGSTVEVWLNSGDGLFFESRLFEGKLPKPGKSLTVGDFNHDGRPDIYVALADKSCKSTQHDLAADVVFWGNQNGLWDKGQLTQDYDGCGHEVQTLDGDKVLLVNGGSKKPGPNYVLTWSPD